MLVLVGVVASMMVDAPSGIGAPLVSMSSAAVSVIDRQSAPSQVPDLVVEPSTPLPATAAPRDTSGPPMLVSSKPADPGDIIVTARPLQVPGDPLQQVNARSFKVTQAVDAALVGPVALAYEHATPKPMRDGLRNVLGNLHEPVVFLAFLLQLKPGKAAETAGRFVINSTLGAAGLFDIAKRTPFRLPRRANGLADTLGFYGVKPGAFLFLPLIGPTTVRDLFGNFADRLLLPLSVGGPFKKPLYTLPVGVLSALDRRANFDEKLHEIRENSADPYAAVRSFYLQRRQAEIDELRGQHK